MLERKRTIAKLLLEEIEETTEKMKKDPEGPSEVTALTATNENVEDIDNEEDMQHKLHEIMATYSSLITINALMGKIKETASGLAMPEDPKELEEDASGILNLFGELPEIVDMPQVEEGDVIDGTDTPEKNDS